MSKYCPLLERNVVYLDCLECDERICEEKVENINEKTGNAED
jgi:hypothetical protein